MIDIQKELQDYWKAENALRDKICGYLDNLNKKIDFYLRFDNTEEELHFIKIEDGLLMEEHDVEYDYRQFTMGEILDIYDSLCMAEKE